MVPQKKLKRAGVSQSDFVITPVMEYAYRLRNDLYWVERGVKLYSNHGIRKPGLFSIPACDREIGRHSYSHA